MAVVHEAQVPLGVVAHLQYIDLVIASGQHDLLVADDFFQEQLTLLLYVKLLWRPLGLVLAAIKCGAGRIRLARLRLSLR